MSISFSRYVQITSGVGGGAAVSQRDLIGRILTDNILTPGGSVLEFTSAADVDSYYGAESTEAQIARAYFSYVTAGTPARASRIGFGRYAPGGSPARLIGADGPKSLAQLQGVTAGTLALEVDGAPVSVSGIDLSGAVSLGDVADEVQTAVAATTELANATVEYNAVTRRFILTASGLTVSRVTLDADTALSDLLGWGAGALVSEAVDPQTAPAAFTATQNISDNFGSLAVYPPLDLEGYIDLAEAVAAENIKYMLMVPVQRADAEAWAMALGGFAGTAVTLSPTAGQFPELLPMIQLAATNYSARNGVQNYMFRQMGGLTPSVTNDADADAMDALRVNYYGRTQTAGQQIAFYQRGLLMGGVAAPVDMNTHGNEQWLKDAMAASIMELLLSAGRVPANETGRGQVLAVVQAGVDQALFNGVISVGKELTAQQRASVTETTGDPLAWHQLEQAGYWVDARVEQVTGPGGTAEYRVVYLLVYSKDDAIRSVHGTHQLI